MFGKLSSRTCARLLFLAGVLLSCLAACLLAMIFGVQTVLVAVERSADAVPRYPLEQLNVPLAVGIGTAVLALGTLLSYLAAELYYFALEFFRGSAPRK